MRQTTVFAAMFLFGTTFGASALAADQQLMNLVMPDAQVMAGVNVTTAKISPFGQFILAQISANDKGLQEFIAKTGFDPRQDVTEILAASAGNAASPGGLFLAKGTYNVTEIVAAIPAAGHQVVQTYDGDTLITDAKSTHGLAFIGDTIAVAGDLASVKAALDRSGGVNSVSPALAAQVQTLSTTEDAWSVSLESLASLLPGNVAEGTGLPAQGLQFARNILSSSGGVKFGANVQVNATAVADTAQDASALADLIRMLASLASTSSSGHAQLLQSLQVSTDGTSVNIAVAVPEAQIESLITTASTPKPTTAKKFRRL